ncbi:hypothetical protein DDE19_29130 [Micromonospora ureilytica]|uniref:Flavin reductase n=1 Tax=Micromonospora ureilytica TaxID=709868 RepID=A0A3N9XH15_9ACTN|nr:hypothetical protein [Micromonospora ureilytica]RQX12230.1 hypothetical protein DDE19_29130 [Micromonospora ureilytica]
MGEVPTTARAAVRARAAQGQRAAAVLPSRLADQHIPRRPEWTCRTCEQDTPWPCAPARVRLSEAYGRDRIGLSMYLGSLHAVVVAELPAVAAGELFERFVGWAR